MKQNKSVGWVDEGLVIQKTASDAGVGDSVICANCRKSFTKTHKNQLFCTIKCTRNFDDTRRYYARKTVTSASFDPFFAGHKPKKMEYR